MDEQSTQATPTPTPTPAPERGRDGGPDPELAGAGLSATGRTAEDFEPGEPGPGTTYGDPGGTGTAADETAAGDSAAGQGNAAPA